MLGLKRRKRLQAEVAILRDALCWYAREDNWRRNAVHAKGEPVKWVKSPAAADRGAIANRALGRAADLYNPAIAFKVTVLAPEAEPVRADDVE